MHPSTSQENPHPNYVLVWGILLFLLMVSIVGPLLGNLTLLLLTAFGVAIIKALMVAAYFMHLNIERRYIWYLLLMAVLFLLVLFTGLAPDVMKHKGVNWEHRPAATTAAQSAAMAH